MQLRYCSHDNSIPERPRLVPITQQIVQDMEDQGVELSSAATVSALCSIFAILERPDLAQPIVDAKLQYMDCLTMNNIIQGDRILLYC